MMEDSNGEYKGIEWDYLRRISAISFFGDHSESTSVMGINGNIFNGNYTGS